MLGHVARSVGGALPGGLGVNPLVGQVSLMGSGQTLTATAPEDATFAFVEVVGRGGFGINGTGASSGGAGNDAIIATAPGASLSVQFAGARESRPTTASLSGFSVAANSGIDGDASGVTPGATGKYPGGASSGTGTGAVGGRGGGRLGGPGMLSGQRPSGIGGGSIASDFSGQVGMQYGGPSIVLATFFRTRDAALAFANSLYGGNWQP